MHCAVRFASRSLHLRLRNGYFLEDMLGKNYLTSEMMIYKPAMKLYKDKIFTSPFNERIFTLLLLENEKMQSAHP